MNPPKDRSFLYLFWILAFVGLMLDQATKYGIFAALYNEGLGGFWVVVPETFNLVAAYSPDPIPDDHPLRPLLTISGQHFPRVNRGALWGIGQGNTLVFAAISFLAAVAVTYWVYQPGVSRDRLMAGALGLILAGTLGNLYDRIVFDGVRDFFHWYRWIDWPVFNVADCCLVCGAGLLLVHAFFVTEPKQAHEPIGA